MTVFLNSKKKRQKRYLNKFARGEMHFYHKHNRDPDHRAGQHQPPEHHGPARVVVSSVSHRFPLVKTEAENKLEKGKENKQV